MRLFLSIALTDALREQIVQCREDIKRTCFTREQLQRMRWINETEYHVTQYFIGEVSSNRVDELKNVVQPIASSTNPFSLTTDRFEFKPNANPRLLWLRFHSNESFAALQKNLHNALVETDLSQNQINDDPIPHVTLIRLKQVKPLNNELPPLEQRTIGVAKIDLMQSFMKPTGAEYKLMGRFDLSK